MFRALGRQLTSVVEELEKGQPESTPLREQQVKFARERANNVYSTCHGVQVDPEATLYSTGWGKTFKYDDCPRFYGQLPCPLPSLSKFNGKRVNFNPFGATLSVSIHKLCIFPFMQNILFFRLIFQHYYTNNSMVINFFLRTDESYASFILAPASSCVTRLISKTGQTQ